MKRHKVTEKGKKFCYKCSQEKDLQDFTKGMYSCKVCRRAPCREYYLKNKDKYIAKANEYTKKNRNKIGVYWKEYKRKIRYKKLGITIEDFNRMNKIQQGKCCICKKIPDGQILRLDHDHNTGKIRGLLCNHCNIGLGYFRDNIESLKNAAVYLKKNGV